MLPHWVVDVMHSMSGAELKVCLFIARKTIGWHKESDRISLSQFEKGTGLGRRVIPDAIASLESRGLIAVVRMVGKCNTYRLSGGPIFFTHSVATSAKSARATSAKNAHTKEIAVLQKNLDPIDYPRFKESVEDWPF